MLKIIKIINFVFKSNNNKISLSKSNKLRKKSKCNKFKNMLVIFRFVLLLGKKMKGKIN